MWSYSLDPEEKEPAGYHVVEILVNSKAFLGYGVALSVTAPNIFTINTRNLGKDTITVAGLTSLFSPCVEHVRPRCFMCRPRRTRLAQLRCTLKHEQMHPRGTFQPRAYLGTDATHGRDFGRYGYNVVQAFDISEAERAGAVPSRSPGAPAVGSSVGVDGYGVLLPGAPRCDGRSRRMSGGEGNRSSESAEVHERG